MYTAFLFIISQSGMVLQENGPSVTVRFPAAFSIFSIKIPYTMVGSLTSTCVI